MIGCISIISGLHVAGICIRSITRIVSATDIVSMAGNSSFATAGEAAV